MALRAGGLAALRALKRGGARILAYHRFTPSCVDTLRSQCEYLRKFHHCVSLGSITSWLMSGRPIAPNALSVTIDDGYRDFYQFAYPVFRAYGIPVTVFLTTGFLDGECWLWCDVITHLFRRSPLVQAEISFDNTTLHFPLRTEHERIAAAVTLKEIAKRADDDARRTLIEELPELLRCPLPDTPPPEYEPLRWDEVRLMARHGISFGAHTHTHPILSTVRSPDILSMEITTPKGRIESELSTPVHGFAYPNGTFRDVSEDAIRGVKAAGYDAAYMAEFGATQQSANPYMLRRNMTEPVAPVPFFARTILRS